MLSMQLLLVSHQNSYLTLQIANPFSIAIGAVNWQCIGSASMRALGLVPRVEKF